MKKRTTRSTKRAVSFALIAIGMLLSAIGLVADPVGASVNDPDPKPIDGNQTCGSLGLGAYDFEYKINSQPSVQKYIIAPSATLPNGAYIDITRVALVNGRLEFDWNSDVTWNAVFVKQANGGLLYEYNPAVTSDTAVQTTVEQSGNISHVSFCRVTTPPPPPVTGDVTLQKLTTGGAAPTPGTDFTFTVTCESGTVPNSPVQIGSGDPAVTVATGVTVGDDCTITETDDKGAATTVFKVNGTDQPAGDSVTVTVGDANGVAVIATNDFPAAPPRTGDVTLAKVTTGGTAPAPGTVFTFTVDCESGTETTPAQIQSGAAPVTVATDVVLGDDCTITETGTNGAASTVFSVNNVAQAPGTSVTVTVGSENGVAVVATNGYPTTPPPPPPPPPGATTGSLSLDKVVTGEGAVDGTEFAFDIDCSNGLDTSVSLSDTDPAHVISNLPTGTTCEIVETDDGDATDTTWTGGTAIPGENGVSVTIGNGTTVTVTATNDFELEVLPLPPVVRPPTVTPPVVTPPAPPAPPTKVAGVVIPRTLPRTGSDALPLVELGLGMILLGFGAMLFGRERTALI